MFRKTIFENFEHVLTYGPFKKMRLIDKRTGETYAISNHPRNYLFLVFAEVNRRDLSDIDGDYLVKLMMYEFVTAITRGPDSDAWKHFFRASPEGVIELADYLIEVGIGGTVKQPKQN